MRKFRILAMALALTVVADSAMAQFIIGVQGSYLTGSGGDKKGQFGIGAQGKVKISNAVAVGGTVRSWLKNYQDYSGSGGARSADATTQLAGMLEIYFGKRVQPYIGTDAGLYFTNTVIQSGSNVEIGSEKSTNFGIAPKVGIQFNTGFVSPFIQAQYHMLFGGGDEIVVPGTGGNPWNIESQKKFTTLDFGLLFQIGRVGGKGNKKSND
jgi:hypothetical protein